MNYITKQKKDEETIPLILTLSAVIVSFLLVPALKDLIHLYKM